MPHVRPTRGKSAGKGGARGKSAGKGGARGKSQTGSPIRTGRRKR